MIRWLLEGFDVVTGHRWPALCWRLATWEDDA